MEKEKKFFPPREEKPKVIETPEVLKTWAQELIDDVSKKGETTIQGTSQRMKEFENSDELEGTRQKVAVIQKKIEDLVRETKGAIEKMLV